MTIMSEKKSVLVIQTAQPAYVNRAMADALRKNLLGPAVITLFCRALPDEIYDFQGESWINEFRIHDASRGVLEHLLELRQRRFETVIVFFTRDPSYWKAKIFAFFCRGHHLLIFNEHLGCFYFTRSTYLDFIRSRLKERKLRIKQKMGYTLGTSQGYIPPPSSFALKFLRPFHLTLKVIIFPARFVYLLLWTTGRQFRRRRFLQKHNIMRHS